MPFVLLLIFSAVPILHLTFDESESGWIAPGKGSSLRIAHEPANVRTGPGALEFDYAIGSGAAVAALPLRGVDTARLDSVRFWIKTDAPTAIVTVLSEKRPGGNYSAIFWSTGNTWQRVELDPSDFHLSEGPNDPPDADGKLDLDSIENIGVLDFASFINAKMDPNSPFIAESHAGPHSLFLDDFELLSGAARPASDPAVIDDFSPPQLQWFTLGGVQLKLENHGLRADYEQRDAHSVVVRRQLGLVDLSGKTFLAFDVSSARAATLVFSVELRSPGKSEGPRFNTNVEVEGGGKVSHRELLLSTFGEGQDDATDTLKWDRLKSFSIVDITGTVTGETAKNSLWIGDIRGVGETAGR